MTFGRMIKKGDKSKREKVLVPLAYGSLGSKILITTRTDSVALIFAKVIKREEKIIKLAGLEEDGYFLLLNSHAFADKKNPNDYKRLRSTARKMIEMLFGSPFVAKVINSVVNS
ncbi:hypothetical protein MA16_Dca026771 [Dendrobium catenatum]|uniref:Uncharacterized protein n=1 Tax=Dendrobium catenatum TaxID=906689 RepID=A0A2I0VYW5_9ASPA|nr:hypothetical protein MA16_Dca026771 [Dendrobium catenatum]